VSRPVRYRCPDHGGFVAHVRCGYGSGRAPEATQCPTCQAPSVRDYAPATPKNADTSRRVIILDAHAAERLNAYCAAQGISIDAAIEALVPDVGAKP